MCGRQGIVVAVITSLALACSSNEQPDKRHSEIGRAVPTVPNKSPLRRTWTVAARDPEHDLLELRNEGEIAAEFTLQLNGRGFETAQEIGSAIRALPDEFPNEPPYRKAWRFVRDNRYHGRPLIWKSYLEDPTVLFNSTGFGWCSTSAAVLTQFWRHFGYDTREWELNGHVVSEVFADGRWQLFDGDLEVYYIDDAGRVVGVEDLVRSPDLITKPRLRLTDPSDADAQVGYSHGVADIYTSEANNHVTEYPAAGFELPATKLRFSVPPGGTLRLPRRLIPELRTSPRSDHVAVQRFSNAQLIIPAGWRGPITTPLVVHRIDGAGTLRLGGETWEIDSEALRKRIEDRGRFDHRFYVLELSSPLVITYLVNSSVYALRRDNTVELTGTGLASVALSVVPASSQRESTKPRRPESAKPSGSL